MEVSDPSLAVVYDTVVEGEALRVAVEFLDGDTLADAMSRVDHFDAATVLPVMRHVAAALRAAHGAGMVHGAVCPANIFWLSDGRVVVTDLATAVSPAEPSANGAPRYWSAERQASGEASTSDDVYAWGAIAAAMLSGGAGPLPSEDPLGLLAIVRACLAPADTRPTDGGQLEAALRDIRPPVVVRTPTPSVTDTVVIQAIEAPRVEAEYEPRQPLVTKAAMVTAAWVLGAVAALAGVVALAAAGGVGGGVKTHAFDPAVAARPVTNASTTTVIAFFRVGDAGGTVRSNPRTSSSEMGSPRHGSLLLADGTHAADGGGTDWVHVKDPSSGTWGWIKASEGAAA